jgi:hypothetical protein
VPGLFSEREKENCVNMCQDLHMWLERNPKFLSKITRGDEMWVYGYNLETKQQSQQKCPSPPCPKKTREARSNMKSTLTAFFNIQGAVHYEFVPQRQTVKEYVLR